MLSRQQLVFDTDALEVHGFLIEQTRWRYYATLSTSGGQSSVGDWGGGLRLREEPPPTLPANTPDTKYELVYVQLAQGIPTCEAPFSVFLEVWKVTDGTTLQAAIGTISLHQQRLKECAAVLGVEPSPVWSQTGEPVDEVVTQWVRAFVSRFWGALPTMWAQWCKTLTADREEWSDYQVRWTVPPREVPLVEVQQSDPEDVWGAWQPERMFSLKATGYELMAWLRQQDRKVPGGRLLVVREEDAICLRLMNDAQVKAVRAMERNFPEAQKGWRPVWRDNDSLKTLWADPTGQHTTLANPAIPGDLIEVMKFRISRTQGGIAVTGQCLWPEYYGLFLRLVRDSQQAFGQAGDSPTLGDYIGTGRIQKRYPKAYQKWSEAERLLRRSESEDQITTIGHLCREAMQEFATSLVKEYRPPNVDSDPSHTANRVEAVLDMQAAQMGKTVKLFLEKYWRKVNDLVQRQEHGAQKEGERLVWDDARRVVRQTVVVMFEIDASLSPTQEQGG